MAVINKAFATKFLYPPIPFHLMADISDLAKDVPHYRRAISIGLRYAWTATAAVLAVPIGIAWGMMDAENNAAIEKMNDDKVNRVYDSWARDVASGTDRPMPIVMTSHVPTPADYIRYAYERLNG